MDGDQGREHGERRGDGDGADPRADVFWGGGAREFGGGGGGVPEGAARAGAGGEVEDADVEGCVEDGEEGGEVWAEGGGVGGGHGLVYLLLVVLC